MRKRYPLAALVAGLGLPLFTAGASLAATTTWTGGGGDNNWSTTGNWLNSIAPAPGSDDLLFAGTTRLANSNSFAVNSTFKGIAFAPGAAFTLGGNAIHLNFVATGKGITHSSDIVNNSTSNQTITFPIILDPAKHVIGTGSANLSLTGAITPTLGSTVIFNTGGGTINVAGSGLTTSNGILGGWATIGSNWATLDGSNNVVPYSAYTDVAVGGVIPTSAAANIRIPTSGAAISVAAGVTSINSLLFNGTTANQTINVGAGNKIVLGQNGGIFNATGLTGGSTLRVLTLGANLAGGGTITAGDGVSPATITLSLAPVGSAGGGMTINSVIADNGPAKVSVVLMGGYLTYNTTVAVPNTYTGGTYILQGRVSQALNAQIGQGDVYIFPGGEVNTTSQFPTTKFFIAGNGTTEQNGLGALRLFGVGAAGAQFGGIITLMSDASITATNVSATQITGKLTGTGSLTIGGTNGSQGGGSIAVGKTDGTAANRLDYTGDTIISGHNGGTAATLTAVLKVNTNTAAGLNDNILPHGTTGSFTGGPTGNFFLVSNLVPTASTFNHSAQLDLNGSTQTINGLSSGGSVPGNTFVYSGTAGGVLVIGDSNASGSFGGIISDNAPSIAGGGLSLTKIGTGLQGLSNVNTYTGATNINGGGLSVTGTLPTAGAVNVNTSAGGAGALYGTGTVGIVTLAAINGANSAAIDPGAAGPGTAGTLTAASVTVNAGSTLRFDAFGAAAGQSDLLSVTGAVTFTGASTIQPNATTAGAYTLINATGGITGAPTIGAGDTRLTYVPAISANSITVTASGSVDNVTWAGGAGATWDTHATNNWTGPHDSKFFTGDNTVFNDAAAPNYTVTISSTVSPGSISVNNGSGDYVFSGTGAIVGPGALSKVGARTLTISVPVSLGGGLTLTAGTLNLNVATALGGPGQPATPFKLAGGTLGNTSGGPVTISANPIQVWGGDFTFAGPNDLNLGAGAVTLNSLGAGGSRMVTVTAGTLTIGGAIADDVSTGNGIIKAGAGTLALNGANTYTGTTAINAGVVRVGNFGALGAVGSAAAVTIASGATLDLGGFTDLNVAGGFGAKPFIISGTGSIGQGAIVNTGTVGQTNAFTAVTLAANASIGGDGRGTPFAPNFTGRFDFRTSLDLANHTLTKIGTNQVSLIATTVTAGNLVISQGTLSIETTTSVPDDVGDNIIVSTGATLQFVTNSGTVSRPITANFGAIINDATTAGNATIDAKWTLNGNVTFTSPNASTLVLNGVIGGAVGSITKAGADTLLLNNAANTYAFGTNINGGTVSIVALASLGTGALSFNGGTLLYNGGFTDDVSARGITLNSLGGTIDFNGNSVTLANPITGPGGITLRDNGAFVTLNGASTYSGTTTLGTGTTVIIGANNAYPAASPLVLDGTTAGPTFDLNGHLVAIGGLSALGANASQIGNSSLTTPAVLNFAGAPAATSTYNQFIVDSVNGGAQTTQLVVSSGTLVLGGGNTYSGGTTLGGGTLRVSSDANLGAASGPITFFGGTLQATADLPTGRSITVAAGGGTLSVDPTFTFTASGPVGGSAALTKAGDGTFNITGTQTWTSTASLNASAGTTNIQTDPGSETAYNLAVNVTPAAGASTLHLATNATDGEHLRDLRVNAVGVGGAGLLIIDPALSGAAPNPKTGFGALGGSVATYLGNGAGGSGFASRATVENLWRSAALEGYWALQNHVVTAITRGLTLDPTIVTDPTKNGLVVIPSTDNANNPATYVGEDINGDTNGDGKVDINDLGFVLQHLGTVAGTLPGEGGGVGDPVHFTLYTPAEGDVNGDLVTNISDLGIVLGALNQSYAPASSGGGVAAVPEPASMLLMGLGATALLRRRRRHS